MAKEVDTKGYVKMYRKAQEDEVFKNPYAWQLYTYCLFNATFDSRYGEVGTLITSKKEISEDLNITRPTLDKFMKFLKVMIMNQIQNSGFVAPVQESDFQHAPRPCGGIGKQRGKPEGT